MQVQCYNIPMPFREDFKGKDWLGLANRTNLIAQFGRDLLDQGYIIIPNLLLRSYRSLGIDDQELVVLLQLIYLRSAENEPYPGLERLVSTMSTSISGIEECINRLLEKKVISVDKRIDPETLEILPFYNMEGLFDKLAEVWAIEKHNDYEEQQRLLQARREKGRFATSMNSEFPLTAAVNTVSETASKVYKAFENEFGRPLSPMEGELIIGWCDQFPIELVIEALRISVIQGTINLRYIERILQDWQRKNIRNLRDVRELEEAYTEKKANISRTRIRSNRSDLNKTFATKEDKYRDLYSI